MVLIAPLTYTLKKYPSRVTSKIAGLPSEIVLDQIRAVEKIRFMKKIAAVDANKVANIKTVLGTMFS